MARNSRATEQGEQICICIHCSVAHFLTYLLRQDGRNEQFFRTIREGDVFAVKKITDNGEDDETKRAFFSARTEAGDQLGIKWQFLCCNKMPE